MRLFALLLVLASVRAGFGYGQPEPAAVIDESEVRTGGAALAGEILSQKPAGDLAQTGQLRIRDASGNTTKLFIRFSTIITPTNWVSVFFAATETNGVCQLNVLHVPKQPGSYRFGRTTAPNVSALPLANIALEDAMSLPFGGSDFSFADLGLEFFRWPEQRLLKKEMRRSRSCRVLESVNPQPGTNGYSRVVSWIDRETLGIVFAEAYDTKGKLLKEFSPKEFKKVNGQWQLQEMELRNVQTGSRSRIEFNLADGQ